VIGQRDGGCILINGRLHQPFQTARAVEEAVVGMIVKVDEGHLFTKTEKLPDWNLPLSKLFNRALYFHI